MTDQLEMIDIHAHILPGIDDGARNWEETGRLLEAARESAILSQPPIFPERRTWSS